MEWLLKSPHLVLFRTSYFEILTLVSLDLYLKQQFTQNQQPMQTIFFKSDLGYSGHINGWVSCVGQPYGPHLDFYSTPS